MNPDTVTHLSTNLTRRRLTSLIETNALPLRRMCNMDCPTRRGSQYPLSERHGLAVTAFAAWRVDISLTHRYQVEIPLSKNTKGQS